MSLRCCVFTLLALAVGVVHLAAQIAAPPRVAPQAVAKAEELPPHVPLDLDDLDEDEVAGRPKVHSFVPPVAAEFTQPIDLWLVVRDRRGGMVWRHTR